MSKEIIWLTESWNSLNVANLMMTHFRRRRRKKYESLKISFEQYMLRRIQFEMTFLMNQ